TWAVPTQPPARPQTVTPGSTRGPTQKTVIARRELNGTPRDRAEPYPKPLAPTPICPLRTTPPLPAPKMRLKGCEPTVYES
ncbi:MAG: hypothetical protein K0Q71_6365, partial [Thermomicrobiales bacterium]|nr:hypothetical protein [Thermomicrobiales bacterium]